MTKAAIQAGIYCRLSLAVLGDTTNVKDQEQLCRELAGRLGWPVAEVYVDNNRSAWQKNRKRKDWDRMLADVGRGHVNALLIYHGDRLIRHPKDLETLIELADTRGIKLASPTGTRDLDNADDRTMLRVEAAFAWRESANTSRRVKRDIERRRLRGVVNSGGRGGRLFGFGTDGVTPFPPDRCSLATRKEVIEADIVREVFSRALAGEGIRHIAAALAARGITTTAGKRMHSIAVRRIIASPRYAGLMPDGVTAASWQPIVSREDWEAACALVSGRADLLSYWRHSRKYLLSGIAKCGACGAPMQVLTEHTIRKTGRVMEARYGCLTPPCRKVYRKLEHLDEYVITRTLAKLGDPRNPPGRIASAPGLATEMRTLAEERAAIEAAITDHTKGPLHLLLGRLESADKRLAQLRELLAADTAARIASAHAGLTREEWDGLPLATRRALVAACFTVTVLPASKRGPGFRTEDVRLAKPGA